ncbi:restriction endonuclease subunit S [Rhizobium johnstonii]|uniref:restriction endonuclease subunit S n=1 Tax=Rhizobium johnstonii TaxID=3019933 RepID=UPI003F97C36A
MSELPQGWVEATIEEVTHPFITIDPTRSPEKAFRYVDIGSIDNKSQTIGEPKSFLGSDAPSRARRVIQAGDTLFSTVRTYLKNVAMVPKDMDGQLTSTGIAVLRPNGAVNNHYLFRWSSSDQFIEPLSAAQDGTMYPAVSDSDVSAATIPLPPLPEQQRIVAKIDSLTGKSKRARDHLDHIPRLVEKYKQAVLAAAFRGDLTREWRAQNPSGTVSIGDLEKQRYAAWTARSARGRYADPDELDWRPDIDLPSGWIWASVDQLSYLIQYGSSAKTNDDSAGVAVLRMGNLQGGDLDFSSLKFLPSEHPEFPELLLQSGDLLFNRTNSAELVGKTAVYLGMPRQASFASYLIRIKACGMNPQLLSAYINSAIGREWVASVVNQQVGQANVNGTKLRCLGVPVMPTGEQQELLQLILSAFSWIDRLASEATNGRKLIDHLDRAVLAKAFRGELVPQDPADEPASVLLERIRADREAAPKAKRGRKARFE